MSDISKNIPQADNADDNYNNDSDNDILIDESLSNEIGPRYMVKVKIIKKDNKMDNNSTTNYMDARLKEVEIEEIEESKRYLQLETDLIRKLVNRLSKVETFEEHPLNFDTNILFEITAAMKVYSKKILELHDDNEIISINWALLEVLISSLFNELYRSDRSFVSKWAILDEINDFFINFLNKDLEELKNSPEYDIAAVGPTVLFMLRQTYKMNILKLYTDTRLNEHLHDINEVLVDDGILYVKESEVEFYAKVEECVVSIFMESKNIKKIVDNILEKIY